MLAFRMPLLYNPGKAIRLHPWRKKTAKLHDMGEYDPDPLIIPVKAHYVKFKEPEGAGAFTSVVMVITAILMVIFRSRYIPEK